MVKEITERLDTVNGASDQERALEVMAALKELNLGTKMHETRGKYFESNSYTGAGLARKRESVNHSFSSPRNGNL